MDAVRKLRKTEVSVGREGLPVSRDCDFYRIKDFAFDNARAAKKEGVTYSMRAKEQKENGKKEIVLYAHKVTDEGNILGEPARIKSRKLAAKAIVDKVCAAIKDNPEFSKNADLQRVLKDFGKKGRYGKGKEEIPMAQVRDSLRVVYCVLTNNSVDQGLRMQAGLTLDGVAQTRIASDPAVRGEKAEHPKIKTNKRPSRLGSKLFKRKAGKGSKKAHSETLMNSQSESAASGQQKTRAGSTKPFDGETDVGDDDTNNPFSKRFLLECESTEVGERRLEGKARDKPSAVPSTNPFDEEKKVVDGDQNNPFADYSSQVSTDSKRDLSESARSTNPRDKSPVKSEMNIKDESDAGQRKKRRWSQRVWGLGRRSLEFVRREGIKVRRHSMNVLMPTSASIQPNRERLTIQQGKIGCLEDIFKYLERLHTEFLNKGERDETGRIKSWTDHIMRAASVGGGKMELYAYEDKGKKSGGGSGSIAEDKFIEVLIKAIAAESDERGMRGDPVLRQILQFLEEKKEKPLYANEARLACELALALLSGRQLSVAQQRKFQEEFLKRFEMALEFPEPGQQNIDTSEEGFGGEPDGTSPQTFPSTDPEFILLPTPSEEEIEATVALVEARAVQNKIEIEVLNTENPSQSVPTQVSFSQERILSNNTDVKSLLSFLQGKTGGLRGYVALDKNGDPIKDDKGEQVIALRVGRKHGGNWLSDLVDKFWDYVERETLRERAQRALLKILSKEISEKDIVKLSGDPEEWLLDTVDEVQQGINYIQTEARLRNDVCNRMRKDESDLRKLQKDETVKFNDWGVFVTTACDVLSPPEELHPSLDGKRAKLNTMLKVCDLTPDEELASLLKLSRSLNDKGMLVTLRDEKFWEENWKNLKKFLAAWRKLLGDDLVTVMPQRHDYLALTRAERLDWIQSHKPSDFGAPLRTAIDVELSVVCGALARIIALREKISRARGSKEPTDKLTHPRNTESPPRVAIAHHHAPRKPLPAK